MGAVVIGEYGRHPRHRADRPGAGGRRPHNPASGHRASRRDDAGARSADRGHDRDLHPTGRILPAAAGLQLPDPAVPAVGGAALRFAGAPFATLLLWAIATAGTVSDRGPFT